MNITLTEWKAMEEKINAAIIQRWPWLHRPDRGRICVESPALSVSADLRASGGGAAIVRLGVDSSACFSGGIASVAESCRQVCKVRDAMLYVSGVVDGVVVWQDGECPCGFCSARGTNHGTPCGHCNGAGKR